MSSGFPFMPGASDLIASLFGSLGSIRTHARHLQNRYQRLRPKT